MKRLVCLMLMVFGWAMSVDAAVLFMDAGSDATFDLSPWDVNTGGNTSSTDSVYTGPRAIKMPSSGELGKYSSLSSTAGRISLRFYPSTSVSSGGGPLVYLRDSSDVGQFIVNVIGSDKSLKLSYRNGNSDDGSGGVWTLDAWNRVSVAYTITSQTVNEVRVFLNGTLVISASNLNLTDFSAAPSRFLLFGASDIATYFDDIYTDDSNSLTDTGDIRVTAKRPSANNVNNFTTAVGANPSNRWTNVNERPLSETNGWEDLILSDRENYGIEASSAGDVDLTGVTLVARGAWIWAKGTTGGLGTPAITDNGADTGITLTSAGKFFAVFTATSTYPSDVATIGILGAGTTDNTFLYEAGMMIAYTATSMKLQTKTSSGKLFSITGGSGALQTK